MSLRCSKTARLLFVWGLIGCQSEPTLYYFRELKIGPDGHFIRVERLPSQPATGSYYSIFRGSFIDMVSHYASVKDQPGRVVLLMTSDQDRRLLETTRIEQIATGPYGTLSLEKDCFYKRPPSGYRSSLLVRAYLNDAQLPAQTRLTELPPSGPGLTEVSLLRIMQSSSSYLIAAATYEASGRLGNIAQSTVRPGGELISGVTSYNRLSALQAKTQELGLLPEFHAADYMRTHRILLPPTPKPETDTMIVFRYGFDKFLQIDTISDGRQISSTYLEPYVSPEDAVLNDRCDSDLRNQVASGEGTTD